MIVVLCGDGIVSRTKLIGTELIELKIACALWVVKSCILKCKLESLCHRNNWARKEHCEITALQM